ncbi:MAG: hypothetical protein BAJALOKI1v1_2560004 [Promethearchaeota archaeon]|nr:MAG: hypothetical protein BAJALOKI1v1_2560004 [Candidatus Lokiarchaeota archaeon]
MRCKLCRKPIDLKAGFTICQKCYVNECEKQSTILDMNKIFYKYHIKKRMEEADEYYKLD